MRQVAPWITQDKGKQSRKLLERVIVQQDLDLLINMVQNSLNTQLGSSIQIPQASLQYQLSSSGRTNSREDFWRDENGTFSTARDDYSQNSNSTEVTDCLPGKSQSPCIVAMKGYWDQRGKEKNSILGCHEQKGPPSPLASPHPKVQLKSFLGCTCWDTSTARSNPWFIAGAGCSSCPIPSWILAASMAKTTKGQETVITECQHHSEIRTEINQTLSEVLLTTLSHWLRVTSSSTLPTLIN